MEFPREGLSESAALGLFIILNAVEDGLIPVNRAEFYASQCAVHPGLPARLPVYLQAFEVHRLRHGGRFAEGLGLAMRQARQLPRASGHGTAYPLLEELGKWLAKDPKALPDGLPAMREPEWRPAQAAFLRGLLYPGENNLIFSKDRGWAEKYDLFNRMARSQDWVDAALHAGEQSFYHMRMARDGHLADAVLTHERDGDTMSMNALGGLLPAKPELAEQIPAGKASAAVLFEILKGVPYGGRYCDDKTSAGKTAASLLEKWGAMHPGLEDMAGEIPEFVPALASLAWKRGDRIKAIAMLGAPIKDEYGKEISVNHTHLATLAGLLESLPAGDLPALLEKADVPSPALGELATQWLRRFKTESDGLARPFAVIRFLRARAAAGGEPMPMYYFLDKDIVLMTLWTNRKDSMLDDLLPELLALASCGEFYQEQDLWQLVEVIGLRGKAEEILASLDAMPPAVRDSSHDYRRAALLRVLGRQDEATKLARAYPGTHLAVDLARYARDGDALAATLPANESTKASADFLRALHAACAGRELPAPLPPDVSAHPYILLMQGDAAPYRKVRGGSPHAIAEALEYLSRERGQSLSAREASDRKPLADCWTPPREEKAAQPPPPRVLGVGSGNPDPRAPDFSLPAGLLSAKAMGAKGDKEGAATRIRESIQRMFLDYDCLTRSMGIELRSNVPGFPNGMGMSATGNELALLLLWTEDLDPEVSGKAIDACWRSSRNGETDLIAAHAYARIGAYDRAAKALEKFLGYRMTVNTIPEWAYDVYPLVSWFWELEGYAAFASGNQPDRLARALDRRMALDPFTSNMAEKLQALATASADPAARKSVSDAIAAALDRYLAKSTDTQKMQSIRQAWMSHFP